MLTQRQVVKNHLEEHGSITSMEAFRKYGITRLSSVIYDLRANGLNIESEDAKSKNRYGTSHYAKYVLVK